MLEDVESERDYAAQWICWWFHFQLTLLSYEVILCQNHLAEERISPSSRKSESLNQFYIVPSVCVCVCVIQSECPWCTCCSNTRKIPDKGLRLTNRSSAGTDMLKLKLINITFHLYSTSPKPRADSSLWNERVKSYHLGQGRTPSSPRTKRFSRSEPSRAAPTCPDSADLPR